MTDIKDEIITSASWEIIRTLNEFRNDSDVRVEEISKALKEKNIDRVVKKILGILLENKSLSTEDVIENLITFNKVLKQRLKSL